MKQNICVEQVKKLSVEELNKLIPIIDMPKYNMKARLHILCYENNVLNDIALHCTIGKMIETLHDNNVRFIIDNKNDEKTFYLAREDNIAYTNGRNDRELCDLLWNGIYEGLLYK